MADKETRDSDVAFIQALAELLRDNDLTEIEVKRDYGEDDGLTVRVSRAMAAAPAQMIAPAPLPPATPATPQTPATDGKAEPSDPSDHPGAVTSPMVGTAYLQPEPGSTPFAPVGKEVREGDTVLIIEAMKTMNQIPAPRSGKVKRVFVEDGTPVEYGAPLMIIE